jgi:hypothetical protein
MRCRQRTPERHTPHSPPFLAGHGPSTAAEYQTPQHVAPEIVDLIACWISSP